MPLMLSQRDVRPLLDDYQALDDAIAAIEASLRRSHGGEHGEVVFTGLGLANGDELATYFTATPSGPASLRVFPNLATGQRPDAWLGMRIDGHSGAITSMIALDDLNVLRTAVPAAVGVRHLAPQGATTLAILGSGAQASAHLRSISRVMPDLEHVRVWSPTPANRERFGDQFRSQLSCQVDVLDSAQAAVDGADVITAAGRYGHTDLALESPGWVKPGALFVSMTFGAGMNLVGAGAVSVVPTSHRPEIVAVGFSSGFMSGPRPTPPVPPLELGDVIAGTSPARQGADETLVFQLAAPYLWDVPIFDWVVDWANAHGVGTTFDFSTGA
jgi:alanine dehydrogenase